jgi:hypothetical protein
MVIWVDKVAEEVTKRMDEELERRYIAWVEKVKGIDFAALLQDTLKQLNHWKQRHSKLREALALIAEGEGDDASVYMKMAEIALAEDQRSERGGRE